MNFKKFVLTLILVLPVNMAFAVTPMSSNLANDALSAATYIIINNGTDTAGQPVLMAKWAYAKKRTTNYQCSITTVAELTAARGDRTLSEALLAPTSGGFWTWDSTSGSPPGINPWCLQ